MSRYLTEESLGQLLITLYPNANIAKQFAMKIPGTGTKRIDYMVTTDDGMIAVEYDGHLHYTDPVRQLRDMLVKAHCAHNNIKFVQFPYWLQPSSETVKHFFGIESWCTPSQYPHGFIDAKCVLPAMFNHIGYKRFVQEMSVIETKFPELHTSVVRSLDLKCEQKFEELAHIPYLSGMSELMFLVEKLVCGEFKLNRK